MALFRVFRKRKRKYPLKLDEWGKSARQRCFEMFQDGRPAVEIAEKVGVPIGTVRKYHQQWKKNPNLDQQQAYLKELIKDGAPDRDRNLELIAKTAGVKREEIEAILSQPHGLRRMMTGKFYFPGNAEADHKRYVAFELAMFISNHLISTGKFEDVSRAFELLIKQSMTRRKQEEQETKEDNEEIEFIRAILAADVERERQTGLKPERLSPEERDAIRRWPIQKAIREIEVLYWANISNLVAGRLTEGQAREKIYQDLIDKGDIEGATMIRQFQNAVHPLKTGAKPKPPPNDHQKQQ
jgi:hypothetical protein